MNELDQFIKHELKVKYYARYTDDFVIISPNIHYLKSLLSPITKFLSEKLKLQLHPKKITIRKYTQGVDFLGYVILPYHRLLRKRTKERIFRKLKYKVEEYKKGLISEESLNQIFQSYLGVLSHADTYRLKNDLKNQFCFLWNK